MRDEEIFNKIKEAVKILEEIDIMISNQSIEIQNVDYKLSDLLHLIENNELSDEASINVIKEIHKLRKYRRSLQNEHEIENTYNTHKNKLIGKENRPFLLNEISKTIKQLGKKYNNRVYTEEEINELITPKKKRGRPKKEKI